MTFMNEPEFVARALTDLLSSYVTPTEIDLIHDIVMAGEPITAIGVALGIASTNSVAVPEFYRDKIMSLTSLTAEEREWFEVELSAIPFPAIAA